MDQLEIGLYSAFAVYGVIAIWTVLARLRWLPLGLVRSVHRPLNHLEHVPILGWGLRTCRSRPLSLGLVPAILVGAAIPYVVLSVMWLGYFLSFGVVIALGAWAFVGGSEASDGEPDPYGTYVERSGHGLAYGDSPRADVDRPLP
jgi:hypothetical protein